MRDVPSIPLRWFPFLSRRGVLILLLAPGGGKGVVVVKNHLGHESPSSGRRDRRENSSTPARATPLGPGRAGRPDPAAGNAAASSSAGPGPAPGRATASTPSPPPGRARTRRRGRWALAAATLGLSRGLRPSACVQKVSVCFGWGLEIRNRVGDRRPFSRTPLLSVTFPDRPTLSPATPATWHPTSTASFRARSLGVWGRKQFSMA